jgi:hypothetical protein
MRSSGETRPQDEPAPGPRGRHESGGTGRHESAAGDGSTPSPPTVLATVAGVAAVAVTAVTAFGPRRSLVSWSLVLIVTAAALVYVHPGSRRRAKQVGAHGFRARRLIAVIVLLAATITLALYVYRARQQQSAVRRHAELILGVGLHADLDSKDGNWDQGVDGYEGDLYFDTGRSVRPARPPRIQGGLIGPDRWTRLVPLGTGFAVSRRTCTAKLRENPPQTMPVTQLRPGYQFCVETSKRRWAFLTVTGQPGPRRLRLDVLVWESRQPKGTGVSP